jgi:hypothetical protein
VKIAFLTVVFICFSFFSSASAAEEEVQVVQSLDCQLGEDKRRLEVLTKKAGCSLQYYKHGKSSEIAVAKNGVEVCQAALQKVKKTLEGSSYKCK